MNIFYGAISFYGEQTPMVYDPRYGHIEALVERDNPQWMAPYNLRYTRSVKYDKSAQNRWLTIGSYHADGTQIAWDFNKENIVIMYPLPVTMPMKEFKKLKEADYENLIINSWKNFEDFFIDESQRLQDVFKQCVGWEEIDQADLEFWKKTLPIGHKKFQI